MHALLRSFVSLAVALVCIITWSQLTEAAVFYTATLVKQPPGISFASPEAALEAPWVAYQLDLQSTAGELIGAVDVKINGPLHQRWTDGDEDGVFDPTPNANSAASLTQGDSHLVAPTGALFGRGPIEDNSGLGSPLASTSTREYGIGSILDGAWGIQAAATSTTIAYLVVPSGRLHEVDFSIKVAAPNGEIIAQLSDFCPGVFGCSPDVLVYGNGVLIADGDVTPSLLDHTDFGTVAVGASVQRTFWIANTPAEERDFLYVDPPTITGPFSLVGEFPERLGHPASFTLALDTSTPGNYTGSISFGTNVPGKNPFNFSLAARVIPEPTAALLSSLAFIGVGRIVRPRRF